MMVQVRKRRPPLLRPDSRLRELLSPQLFRALADPRRVTLLLKVAQARGPCTVGSIAEGSGVDLSVVSRHLALLRQAGVLEGQRHGREMRYLVRTAALTRMLREVADALEACCPPEAPARGR